MSVIPILLGFDYQARWFWLEALRLLHRQSALARVSIEDRETDGFDDVVSRLVAARGTDVWERPIASDAYQAKFHVDHRRSIGWVDLADPAFIGAKRSLLERLRDAAADADRRGERGRFTLVSPWATRRATTRSAPCGHRRELPPLAALRRHGRPVGDREDPQGLA